jgi:uncharacterized protein (DUF58 family)
MTTSLLPKNLLQRILLKRKKYKADQQSEVEAPLLSRQAIFDLYYRIQDMFRSRENHYDVAHRMLGDNRSVYKGYGLDYEESRPYQHGDELRFMNWRASARTGQFFMKVYREERRPGVFVLVDRRASMRFGTRVRIKAAQAARATALVSFIAQRENAQVGGVILDEEANWIAEQSGAQAAFSLVNQASKPCPPLTNNNEEPSLLYILKVMTRVLTKGSTVYLISDFHDLSDDCRAALMQLGLEHQIVALHIVDPAEIELPEAGKISLTEHYATYSGTNQEARINSDDKFLRETFSHQSSVYIQNKQKILTTAGLSYQRLMSDTENIEQEI